MSNRIITISRQPGSGGNIIARIAAKKLSIPCYDEELINRIAEESGFHSGFVDKHSEDISGGWFSFAASGSFYGSALQDSLFKVQTKVIRDLAGKGPCVIVGRCADFILRDHENVLTVFIHASLEFRATRIRELNGDKVPDPEQFVRNKDKMRKIYYQLFTDRKWGAVDNYTVTLDSGTISFEKCADIIQSLY